MKSLWINDIDKPNFPALEKDIKTDVLIIGAGAAGILTAFMLKRKGVNCVLVDKNEICSGTTKNTTAKITVQHNLIYHKLIEKFDVKTAKMYYQANCDAFTQLCKIAKGNNCDFQIKDNYIYSTDDLSVLKKEENAIKLIGANAHFTNNINLPIKTLGAITFPNQAQIHPLKLFYNLSENLSIYENTFVKQIKNNTAITKGGSITANKIIVTTHFPFINKYGMYSMKMFQNRSYVVALENAPDINGMYLDESENGYSFRNYKKYLLVGGGNHRTGKCINNLDELCDFAKKIFPQSEIKFTWAAQDCITLDEMPYIGQYSKLTPDLFVSTGFNKWGFTSSMLSAMILSELIIGKKNIYSEIFSPKRNMLSKQLFINAGHTVTGLVNFSTKRCPHLGCKLTYNKAEHSWDCSCHGSRIDENGKVIDNPANKP